jgi:hypothetical protein
MHGRGLGGQRHAFLRQDAILPDLERHVFTILKSEMCILLLGHPGANRQSGGQFEFDSQHHSKEEGVSQRGAM